MSLIALTRIQHGELNKDGSIDQYDIAEGDTIPTSFPADALDFLKSLGDVVGEPPAAVSATLDENEELKARVAELEALLDEKGTGTGSDSNTPITPITPATPPAGTPSDPPKTTPVA